MTDKTLNQHIADAIASLKAANDIQRAWSANARRKGYAAAFRDAPQVADHLQLELLEEIVFYDEDASETLRELRRQNGTDEEPTFGRVRLSDVEFDHAAAIGAL